MYKQTADKKYRPVEVEQMLDRDEMGMVTLVGHNNVDSRLLLSQAYLSLSYTLHFNDLRVV